MTVAVVFHISQGAPFVAPQGGPSYELALVYWGISLYLLFRGPGKISIDSKIFKSDN